MATVCLILNTILPSFGQENPQIDPSSPVIRGAWSMIHANSFNLPRYIRGRLNLPRYIRGIYLHILSYKLEFHNSKPFPAVAASAVGFLIFRFLN